MTQEILVYLTTTRNWLKSYYQKWEKQKKLEGNCCKRSKVSNSQDAQTGGGVVAIERIISWRNGV